MITGEAWLLALADQGRHHREIAARLLRMQILTANRTGHVLFLGWQTYRTPIVEAAYWGKMSGLVVECADCHCQATVHYWERAAKMTSAERKAYWKSMRPRMPAASLAYLAKCPGSEIAGLLASSPALPKEGE